MKKNLLYLLLVFVVPAMIISSCKKDDDDEEKGPAYVGIWVLEKYSQAYQANQKQTLTLTETTFENIIALQSNSFWINMIGLRGTTVVTGEDVIITFTEAGAAGTDGNITWQDSESTYFQGIMATMFWGQSTVNAKFSVSGNTLTLKLDANGDDIYSDEETDEYTKQ